ncbi:MAG: DMT family transporter [Parcubacteria group bacterium]|nr:DMT family transporter [Parcubacteria group bacterium]
MSKGIKLAFATAIISGFAVFFSKFAVTNNIDPYQFTTLKNVLVAVVLCSVVLLPMTWRKLRAIKRQDWYKLLAIGTIGGSIPFLLFFKGLSLTTPAMAGFIHKTLFIWASVLAIFFLREKLGKVQWLALGVLLIGIGLVVGIKAFTFGWAEIMILAATLLWSVENVIAKKTLSTVDPKIVAWARMFFGSIILLTYLSLTSGFAGIFTLGTTQWLWIGLSVLFLSGYVLTWYHALAYEKVSVVASVLVLASPITTILNAIYKGVLPTPEKWLGIGLSLVAVIVFVAYTYHLEKKLAVPHVSTHAS